MKKILLLSLALVACGSGNDPTYVYDNFKATTPPQGEEINVARRVADLFPEKSEEVFSRIMNTNVNYLKDRFEKCPKGSHACYTAPNIYLEYQDTYFVQCYLYSHEFLHVALGVVNGDTDPDHVGLDGDISNYYRTSDTVCEPYFKIRGNPYLPKE